jgi:hypothetical protein
MGTFHNEGRDKYRMNRRNSPCQEEIAAKTSNIYYTKKAIHDRMKCGEWGY